MGKPCDQHTTIYSYLSDIAIIRKDRTCQKIKTYEFADLELWKMKYESVDLDSDLVIN